MQYKLSNSYTAAENPQLLLPQHGKLEEFNYGDCNKIKEFARSSYWFCFQGYLNCGFYFFLLLQNSQQLLIISNKLLVRKKGLELNYLKFRLLL